MRILHAVVATIALLLFTLPAEAQESWETQTYTGSDPHIVYQVRHLAHTIVFQAPVDHISDKALQILQILNMVHSQNQQDSIKSSNDEAEEDIPTVSMSVESNLTTSGDANSALPGPGYIVLHELAIGHYRLFVLAPNQEVKASDAAEFVPVYSQFSEDGTYAEVSDTSQPEFKQLTQLFTALQEGQLALE